MVIECASGGVLCVARRREVFVSGRAAHPSPGPEHSPLPHGIIHHEHVWISPL